jgi:hypothetical protein
MCTSPLFPFGLASRQCLSPGQFAVGRGPLRGGSWLAHEGLHFIRTTGDVLLDGVSPGFHCRLVNGNF